MNLADCVALTRCARKYEPSSIGALPIAVARAMGSEVAYLPGLAMRRIAGLHPGNTKTDARDAYVIDDAARTLPHTLRRVDLNDESLADLSVLVGHDDELAEEATAVSNRTRGLLLQIHPAFERGLGENASHKAVFAVLVKFDRSKSGRQGQSRASSESRSASDG